MGVNQFTDLPAAEFKKFKGVDKQMVLARAAARAASKPILGDEVLASLPDSVDWRTKNVVTPVGSQACGDCWAWSATETLESHAAIATGKLFNLSVQELIECVPNPDQCGGLGGCRGATMELGFGCVVRVVRSHNHCAYFPPLSGTPAI